MSSIKEVTVTEEDKKTYGIESLSVDTEARHGSWELFIVSVDGCEKSIIMNLGNMSESQRVREAMHAIHGYCREHSKQHGGYFGGTEAKATD